MVGDVTERSVMVVGLLPPPLLGVSSLDWAPLAAAGGAFFAIIRRAEHSLPEPMAVDVVPPRSLPGLTRQSILLG